MASHYIATSYCLCALVLTSTSSEDLYLSTLEMDILSSYITALKYSVILNLEMRNSRTIRTLLEAKDATTPPMILRGYPPTHNNELSSSMDHSC